MPYIHTAVVLPIVIDCNLHFDESVVFPIIVENIDPMACVN